MIVNNKAKKIICIFLIILPQLIFANITEKRLALIIGNSDYKSAPLSNPLNDAMAMEVALKNCNFEVILYLNVNQKEMYSAVRDFGDRLRNKDIGLFYYAGHALQVKGKNYLIPIKADVMREDEVRFQCVEASIVISKMETANNNLNIIILDACRNNPFRGFRSNSNGLAEMRAPAGTIIQYSTAAGSVAIDYDSALGKNGLYTSILLNYIQTPELEINMLFRKVRKEVYNSSKGKQIPWESNSLMTKEFFFKQPLNPNLKQFHNSKKTLHNQFGMSFVHIPAGSFIMGSSTNEKGRDEDENQHEVVFIRDFYMQTTEVTQEQWKSIMVNNPSAFVDCGLKCPVEQVSWYEVQTFIQILNKMDNVWQYRLPTEAEWEYSARANTKTRFFWGDQADCSKSNYGNGFSDECKSTNIGKTKIVSSYNPNKWGLYDMHGNVSEWCQDWYGVYPNFKTTNPSENFVGEVVVIRGGDYMSHSSNIRSASRSWASPDNDFDTLGFRLVVLKLN